MPETTSILAIAMALFIGCSVAVTLGFGSNVVALPLASFFVDIKSVIPVLALLGLSGSSIIAVKERRLIDWNELRRIVVWAAIGFPIGFICFSTFSGKWLDWGVGIVVTGVAVHGLVAQIRRRETGPPHPVIGRVLLITGGLVHGAVVTGGPLIVAYTVHAIREKGRFRATMFSLWVFLNFFFVVPYWIGPQRQVEVFWTALCCTPALAAGLWLGQKIHHRLPQAYFRTAVLCLLLLAGLSRLLR